MVGREATLDVVVIGAGPAGVVAARRAAELGASTALVTRDALGGMAAADGPVPVRVLGHAARLLREARQLDRYGILARDLSLDFPNLLIRVREVVNDVQTHSALRDDLERTGVHIYERAGSAHFTASHTIETDSALRFSARNFVLCSGGTSRRLPIPGFELTATHSDAWQLTAVPASLLVVGAGATGVQVASIFNAFGSKVQLFEAAPRILLAEDEDVSAAIAAAFREGGMVVREGFGTIERFERDPLGIRMIFARDGVEDSVAATLAVIAVGWVANTAGLNLGETGVETNARGYVQVNAYQQTAAQHIFAAGDITGLQMLVPQALQQGYVAGTNAAARGVSMTLPDSVSPTGSFTDPEYAQVGLTEWQARENRDVLAATVRFDSVVRPLIDGRPVGFCKLIVDRERRTILGCHIVGERAVELAQVAAVAMSAGMSVDALAAIPLSFPTTTGALGQAAVNAVRGLR